MNNEKNKIIFFLHLNKNTVDKDAIPAYNNGINKEIIYPSLLCKIRNKIYQTVYTMYLIDFPILNKNDDSYFFLQIDKNMKYPFEINYDIDKSKHKNPYYFYFEKIIFKQKLKNNFLGNIFSKSKDLEPPFSCDITIYEQAQLIHGYINSQKRKEQFELLQSLKEQIGFGKFSRLTNLFLMYLKIIFVDNYNTELIEELLSNYANINFDIKPSFNLSLFFDDVIKPIFLKPYKEKHFFINNNFEYDLRNCLDSEYNRIFDKLCLKYYIFYDKDFLMDENNFKSRMTSFEQKNKIYELFYEILSELNEINYCKYLIDNNFLSKEFIRYLFITKKIEINNIKNKKIKEININNFSGLKIYELDKYKIPFYCLGKLSNNYSFRSIDDRELYIFDEVLNKKISVDYTFSKNTTSLFQMSDGNFIIVYSNRLNICIIEIKNIFNEINLIYSFLNYNTYKLSEEYHGNNSNKFIVKAIEIKNKNIVILYEKSIAFYYNKVLLNPKENEDLSLYEYINYDNILQKNNNNMNISLLEFNNNFLIVISVIMNNLIIDKYYLTFINVTFDENLKVFNVTYTKNELFGVIFYNSVFEDNNILIKLSDEILGIGGKYIYLYSLIYKEVCQIIEIPFNNYLKINFPFQTVSSFFITNFQIIYVAVKYFKNTSKVKDFEIKFYLYCFLEINDLYSLKVLKFLSEAKPNSQEPFFSAVEIRN